MKNEEQNTDVGVVSGLVREAISEQMDTAQSLDVRVDLSAEGLLEGKIEGVEIEGEGVRSRSGQLVEVLDIRIGELTLDRLKALVGNVDLTHPGRGRARIILTEKDIETALRDFPSERLRQRGFKEVGCSFSPGDRMDIKARSSRESIELSAVLTLSQGIVLTPENERGDAETLSDLATQLTAIANLQHLNLEGMELKVDGWTFEGDRLILDAEVCVRELP